MFRIDESAGAADLLHLSDDVQREGRLTRTFRPVDFHHAAAGQASHAQRNIEPQRSRAHDFDVFHLLAVGHTHDGALAEFFFDESDGRRQCFFTLFLIGDSFNLRKFLILFLVCHDRYLEELYRPKNSSDGAFTASVSKETENYHH